jgi:hypothetical protein
MKIWILFLHTYGEGSEVLNVYANESEAEAECDRLRANNKGAKSHGFTVEEHEVLVHASPA